MTTNRCPVCGMTVTDTSPDAEHLGMHYRFCSQQCRENFMRRPSLYVGKNAPKRQGKAVHKCRKFRIDTPLAAAEAEQLDRALQQLMGIERVDIHGRDIAIGYDLLQCTAAQIEQCLQECGAHLGQGWGSRLRSGWRRFTEENELDNLAAGEGACCNRPPQG